MGTIAKPKGWPYFRVLTRRSLNLQISHSSLDLACIATKTNHRKLLIKMTSLLSLPRVRANWLPSCDQAKSKICPDSKFVIRFGAAPDRFWRQMLETPLCVNT